MAYILTSVLGAVGAAALLPFIVDAIASLNTFSAVL